MKLLLKFNLIFILVFGAGMGIAGGIFYRFLQQSAKNEVLQQAHLMMQTALASRSYTTHQTKPLLVKMQELSKTFIRQTIPAYAATESFKYLQQTYPDYSYKEATLNPTNLRDRAADWESDVIREFRDHRDKKLLTGERETPTGGSLFLAQPIVAEKACLQCHSLPEQAPVEMLKIYGRNNGFGWQENEVIGAQIVSVPTSLPTANASRAFKAVLLSMGSIAALTLIVLDLVILAIVIRPVTRLSGAADRISRGDLDMPELEVKGKDEIAGLTQSFNRMYLSMVKAIRMLEGE